jgi:O-6-methylguanine DNA methyltransferase
MEGKLLSMDRYHAPFGALTLLSSKRGLCYISFPDREENIHPWVLRTFGKGISIVEDGGNRDVSEELDAYFRGQLREFKCDLDLKGTSFQKKVWEALRGIPYGQTRSYGEIARTVGNPKAVRAVGSANGANPVPIIVPCHRVIQSNGSLGGFGGGLDLKKSLLEGEGCHL